MNVADFTGEDAFAEPDAEPDAELDAEALSGDPLAASAAGPLPTEALPCLWEQPVASC